GRRRPGYPGRESNPQCPEERTAFKAADFAVCPPGRDLPGIVRPRSRKTTRCRDRCWGHLLPKHRSTSPAPDRRRVARSPGWFYLGAPLIAEVWLAFQDERPAHLGPLLAICAAAQLLGLLLATGFADRAPAPVLKGLLALANVFVAGVLFVSGEHGHTFAY